MQRRQLVTWEPDVLAADVARSRVSSTDSYTSRASLTVWSSRVNMKMNSVTLAPRLSDNLARSLLRPSTPDKGVVNSSIRL